MNAINPLIKICGDVDRSSVPRYYVDITLRRKPRLPGFGEWVFVERIIFDHSTFGECLADAGRRILGGVMEWHENTCRFTRGKLAEWAEETKRGQANSGHPDVWDLPAWRKKFILHCNKKGQR